MECDVSSWCNQVSADQRRKWSTPLEFRTVRWTLTSYTPGIFEIHSTLSFVSNYSLSLCSEKQVISLGIGEINLYNTAVFLRGQIDEAISRETKSFQLSGTVISIYEIHTFKTFRRNSESRKECWSTFDRVTLHVNLTQAAFFIQLDIKAN